VALVGAAHAADAIVYETPEPMAPVVPEVYSWTGWYFGAFGGVGTGDAELNATDGTDDLSVDISSSGAFGGGQAGFDYQTGNWVFGAVADIAATSYGADAELSGDFGEASAESQLDYLGTVRARAGWAMDRTLFYGHGGFAYGKMDQEVRIGDDTVFEGDTTKTGWTVGAGIEHAFTDNLSFQTEYSYVDLGDDEVFSGGGVTVEEDTSFHMIKAAVNFRF
jgi:outer membrane immunogenic protein